MYGIVKFSVYPKVAKVVKNYEKENVKILEENICLRTHLYSSTVLDMKHNEAKNIIFLQFFPKRARIGFFNCEKIYSRDQNPLKNRPPIRKPHISQLFSATK